MKNRMLVLSALLLAACSSADADLLVIRSSDGQELSIRVEFADTEAEHTQGLMHRTVLADGDGMLFRFAEERKLNFWMKDTLIPLDIAFFKADGTFVSSATMTPCDHDPCKQYFSGTPAAFALEVPSGYLSAHGVSSGSMITNLPALPPRL